MHMCFMLLHRDYLITTDVSPRATRTKESECQVGVLRSGPGYGETEAGRLLQPGESTSEMTRLGPFGSSSHPSSVRQDPPERCAGPSQSRLDRGNAVPAWAGGRRHSAGGGEARWPQEGHSQRLVCREGRGQGWRWGQRSVRAFFVGHMKDFCPQQVFGRLRSPKPSPLTSDWSLGHPPSHLRSSQFLPPWLSSSGHSSSHCPPTATHRPLGSTLTWISTLHLLSLPDPLAPSPTVAPSTEGPLDALGFSLISFKWLPAPCKVGIRSFTSSPREVRGLRSQAGGLALRERSS